jgi:Cu/Ag efflux pump CusA
LAPLLLEKSRQAQFLKPMAISIAYGIAFATFLTLIMLPIFLAFNNKVKVGAKWLKTGEDVSKEEVERAIKEQHEEAQISREAEPVLALKNEPS